MGIQVLFYMTTPDEDEFLNFIRTTGNVVILPQVTSSELGEEFLAWQDLAGRKLGEGCHLWNKSLSPKPVLKHIPEQECFWLDFMQSEVINVMRSKQFDQKLSMGRLHIEDKVLAQDGTVHKKRSEFVAWFKQLRQWIKKSSPSTFDSAYLSARAAALTKEGIELTGHSF